MCKVGDNVNKQTNIPNKLAGEKSPYLLQHAYNPVAWYPWGEEAFTKAKKEDKPIFLSIGYSTCHWCHVMERESFEDEEVARLLNAHYIAIKVDREERPDVDQIYMTVCQAMTGSGGWPLTIVMTPEQKPFFAGTYFPKYSQYGQPGLMDVLNQLHTLWHTDKKKLLQTGNHITSALQTYFTKGNKAPWEAEPLEQAYHTLKQKYDPQFGGFGKAPKFPSPHTLGFLLRYWKRTGQEDALAMVEHTLTCMHAGGMYDHLGYGFSRYATDKAWLIPHFEKMLYDNALLSIIYLEAYQATGKKDYARIAEEIFTYIQREMTDPKGGFYSAQDADSQGEEGMYYVWTPQEVRAVLGENLGNQFCQWYGVTEQGNFEGRNVLNLLQQNGRLPINTPEEEMLWEEAREKLWQAREKRVPPHTDDKILTAWNGLMIAALAKGYTILGKAMYLQMATKAMDFIWTNLRTAKGRLLARFRDQQAAYLAYLDDYAYVIWALLELYQADFNPKWLEKALALQKEQDQLFADQQQGGYFFNGNDGESLLTRPKEIADGAMPSGNSVSAFNVLRLGRLTGNPDYTAKGEAIFTSFFTFIQEYPTAHCHMLMAMDFALTSNQELVIVSSAPKEQVNHMLHNITKRFSPSTTLLYRFTDPAFDSLTTLAPFVKDMTVKNNKTTFYLCQNKACQQPTNDLSVIEKQLFSL